MGTKGFLIKGLIVPVMGIAAFGGTAVVGQAHAEDYLILSTGDNLPNGLEAAIEAAGGVLKNRMDKIGLAVASSDEPGFAATASAIPGLLYVTPDIEIQGWDATPEVKSEKLNKEGEDYSGLQWALDAMQVPEAWEALVAAGNPGARGAGVRVAVIDLGIDTDHPDIAPNLNLELSRSFVDEPLEAQPNGALPFSHGTFVSSIIAAPDDGVGITGVVPEAELVHLKCGRDLTGTLPSAAILEGIYYAANIGADVINISAAGYFLKSGWLITGFNPLRGYDIGANTVAAHVIADKRAIAYAQLMGATVVASAGNDAVDRDKTWDLVCLPGDLPKVIEVSATGPRGWFDDQNTDLDVPAEFTNYGQSVIDLAGPGGSYYPCWVPVEGYPATTPGWAYDLIISATYDDSWGWAGGTSFSSPYVAGVAALVIAAHGGQMHPDHVRTALEQSADDLGKPGNDDYYGAGRVNALRAVTLK